MAHDTKATERALVRCILRAKRSGLTIIYGAKEASLASAEAVCAMGAYERLGRKAPRLRLPSRSYDLCRAYDAIEHGFDGNADARDDDGRPLPWRWLEVGLRLRARFQPIDVDEFKAREKARVRALMNFT